MKAGRSAAEFERIGGIAESMAGCSAAELGWADRWNSRIDGGSLSSRVCAGRQAELRNRWRAAQQRGFGGQAGGIPESEADDFAGGIQLLGGIIARLPAWQLRPRVEKG